jgi:matrixin
MPAHGSQKVRTRGRPPFALVALALLSLAPRAARAQTLLSVTVIGDPRDPRASAIEEAVTFWNQSLDRLGVGLRFGEIRFVDGGIADRILQELQRGEIDVQNDDALPALLGPLPGEIVIALPDADLMSFGVPWSPRAKGFVALRRGDAEPMSLPNVARNAAAHELGHVLGLDHNSDPRTLMCGRPAPCRPNAFASAEPRFFPLTAEDERRLRARWPRS